MKARKWMSWIGIVTFVICGLWALTWNGLPVHAITARNNVTTGTWVTEDIYALRMVPDNMSARSMALDLYGHPHVAFGGDHLYYAYNAGSGWQVELVDPADNVGQYTSLDLDAAGRPHISYHDSANGDLKYARYDGAVWRIERIDRAGWVGFGTSLDLDPSGRPQICYEGEGELKLAWHDGTSWHKAGLNDLLGPSSDGSLVLDAAGHPHIAYIGAGLSYAYVANDQTWHVEVVDSTPDLGGPTSLALDLSGRPHITYCQVNYWGYCDDLRYAYHNGGQWQIENIVIGGWQGDNNSLALDAASQPHVSYNGGSEGLRYAYYDGTAGWQIETVGPSGGLYSSLVLDASGRPHITYYDNSSGVLKYTYRAAPLFADPSYEAVWQRTDKPITEGRVARSWMWGPRPMTEAMFEPYADSPGGSRLVQYFDKSRMEVNDPNGDRSSPWFVTNGLLVREMVDGWLQVGDSKFEWRASSEEAVAGDPVAHNPNCPLYASFTQLTRERAEGRLGQKVTATLARDGGVGNDPSKAAYPSTEIAYYEEVTGHNVPRALWDFMNQRGLVYEGGRYRSGLVVDWLFAMGYPISEPYWTRCTVAGEEKDVLVQLFERRVLTYTPSNPAGWQVEMGNVGRHYYTWRYGVEPAP